MDLLARITIYISIFLGLAFFTLFSLIAIPHIIDQYEDIWEDYQRSIEVKPECWPGLPPFENSTFDEENCTWINTGVFVGIDYDN